MRKLFFALLAFLLVVVPRDGQADRAIPDDNLAYPVLVSLDTGSIGSGFFIGTNNAIYLVTARHVLFKESSTNLEANKATLLSYSRDPKEKGKNRIELDLPSLLKEKKILRHSTEDVAVVHVGNIVTIETTGRQTIEPVQSVSVLERMPSGIVGADINSIKFFKDILIGNVIYMFGYPISIGIQDHPQIDPLLPLIRSGIVAGTNPARKTIIIDCPSYYGNSGGPVLEVEQVNSLTKKFKIVGVVSEFVPFAETWVNITHKYKNHSISNSGYTIVVPMDPVLELINSP